ncbi:unnamed protein product [Cylicocyclus nassatus]|uniref:Globin domain-containing protein n=1 Tax=Cylicocyclus nassatus TaxID=53992 RepID=A0AA36MD79_CYLNA|nr:unnamed protein product [Cylicocyclus nassatus]
MEPTDVRKHTVESLKVAPIGSGGDFYRYFLATHPEHRRFYKGAKSHTSEDNLESERFDKLGDTILLFVHVLANTFDNESVFRAYVRKVTFKHIEETISPALWKHFWEYWIGFLESKGPTLSAEEKFAWNILGTMFNHECQTFLAAMDRLHA